jgi:hypothetical protein
MYVKYIHRMSIVRTMLVRGMVAWIRSIEKSNDLIGNRTRDLPACSVVPQPTTLRFRDYKCLRYDVVA